MPHPCLLYLITFHKHPITLLHLIHITNFSCFLSFYLFPLTFPFPIICFFFIFHLNIVFGSSSFSSSCFTIYFNPSISINPDSFIDLSFLLPPFLPYVLSILTDTDEGTSIHIIRKKIIQMAHPFSSYTFNCTFLYAITSCIICTSILILMLCFSFSFPPVPAVRRITCVLNLCHATTTLSGSGRVWRWFVKTSQPYVPTSSLRVDESGTMTSCWVSPVSLFRAEFCPLIFIYFPLPCVSILGWK